MFFALSGYLITSLLLAEHATVTNGAPENAPQNIVAVGVAGKNAVCNCKAQGANMITNNAEGDVNFFLFGRLGTGES